MLMKNAVIGISVIVTVLISSSTSLDCYSCFILYYPNNTIEYTKEDDVDTTLENCPIETSFDQGSSCVTGVLKGEHDLPKEGAIKMEFYHGFVPDEMDYICEFVGFGDGSASCNVTTTCTTSICNKPPEPAALSCYTCQQDLGDYCNGGVSTTCASVECGAGVTECRVEKKAGCPSIVSLQCADVGAAKCENCGSCNTDNCTVTSPPGICQNVEDCVTCHSCNADAARYCNRTVKEFDVDDECPPVACGEGISGCYAKYDDLCDVALGCGNAEGCIDDTYCRSCNGANCNSAIAELIPNLSCEKDQCSFNPRNNETNNTSTNPGSNANSSNSFPLCPCPLVSVVLCVMHIILACTLL